MADEIRAARRADEQRYDPGARRESVFDCLGYWEDRTSEAAQRLEEAGDALRGIRVSESAWEGAPRFPTDAGRARVLLAEGDHEAAYREYRRVRAMRDRALAAVEDYYAIARGEGMF